MTRTIFLAAAALILVPGAAMAQAETADGAAAAVQTQTGADATAGATFEGISAAARGDLTAGASVLDLNGGAVGTIESVDGETAVLSTGNARVGIPVSGIGKNKRGLVIALTKAEIEAAAKANAQKAATN